MRLAAVAAVLALSCLAPVTRAAAQSGDGSTAGTQLSLPAGSRAAGLGGAYAAGRDIDVLFYNPAGAAELGTAASMAVQRHIEDMLYASFAASTLLGSIGIGVTVGYFDFGSIEEVRPDPAFGGQRGQATGRTVDAGEAVLRLVAAARLGNRAALGAAAGVLYASLVETGRPAAFFDAGAQYRLLPELTAGVALRSVGSAMSGARLAPAPLPSELRFGLAHARLPTPYAAATARLHADIAWSFETARTAAAAGVELAIALSNDAATALRAGYDGTAGKDAVGRLHLGAGLALDRIAVDYAVQSMDALGTAHRFGIRWSGRSR